MKEVVNKRATQELQTGIHLVKTSKVSWVLDPKIKEPKTLLVNKDGDKAFEVVFVNAEGKTFRNVYWIGGVKQKFFEKMLSHIGLNHKEKMKAKDMLNKQLWIAVCEVVEISGDEIQLDINKNEIKDYFIFKTFPYSEEAGKPFIEGDPAISGVPMYDFRKYKDIAEPVYKKPEAEKKAEPSVAEKSTSLTPSTEFLKEKPVEKIVDKSEQEEPNFGDDEPAKPAVKEEEKKPSLKEDFDEEPNF